MKQRIALLAATLLAIAPVARALTVITTVGTVDCRTWVKHQRRGRRNLKLADRNWLYGFISGFAMSKREDIIKTTTNPDSYRIWVTNYCAANPRQDAADAALALISKLERKAKDKAR